MGIDLKEGDLVKLNVEKDCNYAFLKLTINSINPKDKTASCLYLNSGEIIETNPISLACLIKLQDN